MEKLNEDLNETSIEKQMESEKRVDQVFLKNAPRNQLSMSLIDEAFAKLYGQKIAVTAVLKLQQSLTISQLKQTLLIDLVFKYPKFRSIIVEEKYFSRITLREDPNFDITKHVFTHKLADTNDKNLKHQLLETLVSELVNKASQMDLSISPWSVHLIENTFPNSSKTSSNDLSFECVVVFSIHHCLSDGVGLVQILLDMGKNSFHQIFENEKKERKKKLEEMHHKKKVSFNLFQAFFHWIWHFLTILYFYLLSIYELIWMKTETNTILKPQKISGQRKVCWTQEKFDLEEMKKLGRLHHCTVNDILLGLVSKALSRFLSSKQKLPNNSFLRAVIPVSLRPEKQNLKMGNFLSALFIELPINDSNLVYQQIQSKTYYLKHSATPVIILFLANLLGLLPKKLGQIIVDRFAGNSTLVVTNVPGPKTPMYFANIQVSDLMFFIPPSGDMGLILTIISYCGKVNIGVGIDQVLNFDPHELLNSFKLD